MATDMKTRRERATAQLAELAGEIRLQVHLGGMELKQRWEALEPRLERAAEVVGEVTEASTQALEQLVERARGLAQALRERAEAERDVGRRHH